MTPTIKKLIAADARQQAARKQIDELYRRLTRLHQKCSDIPTRKELGELADIGLEILLTVCEEGCIRCGLLVKHRGEMCEQCERESLGKVMDR